MRIVITNISDKKIQAIKAIRAVTKYGLKEAKVASNFEEDNPRFDPDRFLIACGVPR